MSSWRITGYPSGYIRSDGIRSDVGVTIVLYLQSNLIESMSERGARFTEEEIIVLSYLAKYNSKKLGFNFNSEIYRILEDIFGRKSSSSKAKYENLLYEYSINGVIKENPSNGRSGEQEGAEKPRETEKSRWEYYLDNWDESGEWRSRALSILMIDHDEHNFGSENSDYLEGRMREKLHKVKERNGKLVRDAKAKWNNQSDGDTRCSACGFSFLSTYGELGRDYIEAHHITPFANLEEESKSKISDLAPLCANCHRMIHRLNGSVDSLKEIIHR